MMIRLIQENENVRDKLEQLVDDTACRLGWRGRPHLWFASKEQAAAWIERMGPAGKDIASGIRNCFNSLWLAGAAGTQIAGFQIRLSAMVPAEEMWVVWPEMFEGSMVTAIERWLSPKHFANRHGG